MAYKNTVLSLNPDVRTLLRHEAVFRKSGFEVKSTSSNIQARYEVEMGRCGVFLTSYITPMIIYHDLLDLFRYRCPDALVVYIKRGHENHIFGADIVLSDADEPQEAVRQVCLKQQMKAA
jgi:hypothetical protein